MNICVLNFTQNNILLIKLYMELKSKHKQSAYYVTWKKADTALLGGQL